jgi:signal transduction histidine kinase
MAVPPAGRHDGSMSSRALISLLIIFVSYLAWIRPQGLAERFRTGRWGLLLPLLAVMYASFSPAHHMLGIAEAVAACLVMVFAPRIAAKAAPFALLGLGLIELTQAREAVDGNQVLDPLHFLLGGGGSQRLVLEAGLFFVAGLWLLLHVHAPGAGLAEQALRYLWSSRTHGILRGQEFLVLLPTVMLLGLVAVHGASGAVIDVAAIATTLALAFRAKLRAATLAAAGLLAVGLYGIQSALFFQGTLGVRWYGISTLGNHTFVDAGLQGTILLALGLWVAPRVMGEHLGLRERELTVRAEQLTERVETLTLTRSDAAGTAAAELRRIERDLHDGAQARLVALGMSLRAAEKLFKTSPDAALALVSEAKESSSKALTELRDLVRGIYPPVLADRGLADAVRALALDTPLHTVVDIDLPGEVEMPVGSAVYFAVAEILANAAKHSGARTIRIHLSHASETLRVQVTDDGVGGADPEQGTGLKGVERRLATFDGILAVSSPPGGPTIVVIEVPCASSSLKTSSC